MTDTDICNIALSNIGKGTIVNIEDPMENARACKLYYHPTRETVLRAYPWGFAHRIEKLALLDIKTPGYTFTYAYPHKCLKINKIRTQEPNEQQHEPYTVINIDVATKAICCDVTAAYADYTLNITDPLVMDSLFIEAFTRMLAANICMRLLGNPQSYQLQYQLYQQAVREARLMDAREGHRDAVYHSNYATKRRVR